jgi:hypothetical protein
MVVWILWMHVWLGPNEAPGVSLSAVFKTEAGCKAAVKSLGHDSKIWYDCSMEQVQP